MEFSHKSVLLNETIDALQIKPDGIYVDGTLGGGGHSYEICKRLSDKGRLIGIDQDAAAIEAATERLGEFKDRVTIIRSNYCEMKRQLNSIGVTAVDGIILLLPAGHSRARLYLSGRCAAGHENGSAAGTYCKRYCERL